MSIKQCVVFPMYMMGSWKDKGQELLKSIKGIGFQAVEFWGPGDVVPFKESLEQAKALGLEVASFVAHSHVDPVAGSHAHGFGRAEHHSRLQDEVCRSIDTAAENGIPGLIVLAGHRDPHRSDYDQLVTCAQGLEKVAPYAEDKGVNLNMEILNTTVDHPGYLCDSVDWALALCEMVDSPRVNILFDIYHVQIMEGNIIANIKKAAKRIGHYHTAGNPGRHGLGDNQELNYRGIARAIHETGYNMYVGHEFMSEGDEISALKEAYRICSVE